jgi:hypothetical protein
MLLLRLIKSYATKIWGSVGMAPPFLTSAVDVGEWSVSRPGLFTPEERTPGTHWIGGWGGSQSQSGRCGKEKNLSPIGI